MSGFGDGRRYGFRGRASKRGCPMREAGDELGYGEVIIYVVVVE